MIYYFPWLLTYGNLYGAKYHRQTEINSIEEVLTWIISRGVNFVQNVIDCIITRSIVGTNVHVLNRLWFDWLCNWPRFDNPVIRSRRRWKGAIYWRSLSIFSKLQHPNVLACISYSFVCTLHHLITINVQTLSEDIELIKCLPDIICRVCE